MKKLYALCIGLLAFGTSYAQTTAQNWTKTDCSGKSHNLFAELDSGNVVVLEYVMMNCGSCVTAGNGLKTIINPYTTSHPKKVRLYSIGYTNSYTCTDMLNWKTANNFTHPVFTGGASDVSYYGGMGMPTIVVVGKNNHKVYYKKLGYTSADNAAITSAINLALAQSGPTGISKTDEAQLQIRLFPNPVAEELQINMPEKLADQFVITDLAGREHQTSILPFGSEVKINTSHLADGIYFMNFLKNGLPVGSKRFVKMNAGH